MYGLAREGRLIRERNRNLDRSRNQVKKTIAKNGGDHAKSGPMPQSLSYDSGLAWDNLTPGIAWDGFVTTTRPKRPMASDNRISLEITAAQKAAIVSAVGALKTALEGITINLTVDEKQSLPRISDGTLAFDEKCAAYMASRADLVPSFLDVAEMAKDRKLVADLLPRPDLRRPGRHHHAGELRQLCRRPSLLPKRAPSSQARRLRRRHDLQRPQDSFPRSPEKGHANPSDPLN